MRRNRTYRVCGVLAIAAAMVAAACSSSSHAPAAGLEVVIATDLETPKQYDAFQVEVSQQGPGGAWNSLLNNTYEVPQEAALPTRLAIAPGKEADQDALIKVTAYRGYMGASDPGTAVVVRMAQIQIPLDRVAELTLVLSQTCIGVTCSNPNQSCQPSTGATPGTCGTNIIDPGSLPTYEPVDASSIEGGPGQGDATADESKLDGSKTDASQSDGGQAAPDDARTPKGDTGTGVEDGSTNTGSDVENGSTDTGQPSDVSSGPTNLVTGGNFPTGTTAWEVNAALGSLTISNGEGCVTVGAGGDPFLGWPYGTAEPLVLSPSATYTLSYTASGATATAAVPIGIIAKVGQTAIPLTVLFQTESPDLLMSPAPVTFTHTFTSPQTDAGAVADMSAGLAFGVVENATEGTTVCFQNVSLVQN